MFASDDDYDLQQRVAVASGQTDPAYVTLNLRTDRHEILVLSAVTDTFALAIAHPARDVERALPQAAALGATEWVAPAAQTTVQGVRQYVISGYGKYLRLTPPGGGTTGVATIVYRPLPPTSP